MAPHHLPPPQAGQLYYELCCRCDLCPGVDAGCLPVPMSDTDICLLAADNRKALRCWEDSGKKVVVAGGGPDGLGDWDDLLDDNGLGGPAGLGADLQLDELLKGLLEDEHDGLLRLEAGFTGCPAQLSAAAREGSTICPLAAADTGISMCLETGWAQESGMCLETGWAIDEVGRALEADMALESGGSLQSALTASPMQRSPQSCKQGPPQAHSPQSCKQGSGDHACMGASDAADSAESDNGRL